MNQELLRLRLDDGRVLVKELICLYCFELVSQMVEQQLTQLLFMLSRPTTNEKQMTKLLN